ncbi:Amino acid transporter, transmembrane [Phaffia rhodozyma]|uniref:Amino acid transporter, transmembrane n=1 Tax=Phaffia rhodozyma TaxID=264483 RepID=A0A0F7SJB5_PHARH|nr:Amino acid transporter, transmembrane [Phaffia rhodozyma]
MTDYKDPSRLNAPAQDPIAGMGFGKEPKRDTVSVGSAEISLESGQISERALSWQRTAVLLFTEYIVLAILAFPYSFQVLGMAGGVISTLIVGLFTLFTSHTLWQYCLLHPQIRDIADAAYWIFGEKRIWWYIGFTGLAFNNIFIMGLHCNAGATAINTLRPTICTSLWAFILTIFMWAGSLIRDLRHTTILGIVSAGTMFVCFLVVVIGHGVQGTPNGYVPATATTPATDLSWTVWAPEGTTFVQGVSALLNIVYTFVGQALIPSFVGDMARPEDFGKALYLSMAAELLLFTITGAVVYSYTGTQLTTAPAYGSLIKRFGKPAAALTLPTIIIVGILYSLVTSRAIFFQIFPEHSVHRRTHTKKGWIVWVSIVTVIWIIAYIIGASVPFFSDLLSLISSLFDSWFGFIFWSFAFKSMYKRSGYFTSTWRTCQTVLHIISLVAGLFFFGAGTYAAAKSIQISYSTGAVKTPFTCTNTGFLFTR